MEWTDHTCPICGVTKPAPFDDDVYCQHRRKSVLCRVIGRSNIRAAEARETRKIEQTAMSYQEA
jgi:hypothetical protein